MKKCFKIRSLKFENLFKISTKKNGKSPFDDDNFLRGYSEGIQLAALTSIFKKSGVNAATFSSLARSEKTGKNQALKAWQDWQSDPNKKPYGDERGCNKAFDLDMCTLYKMELETISKWRQKWQKDLII